MPLHQQSIAVRIFTGRQSEKCIKVAAKSKDLQSGIRDVPLPIRLLHVRIFCSLKVGLPKHMKPVSPAVVTDVDSSILVLKPSMTAKAITKTDSHQVSEKAAI